MPSPIVGCQKALCIISHGTLPTVCFLPLLYSSVPLSVQFSSFESTWHLWCWRSILVMYYVISCSCRTKKLKARHLFTQFLTLLFHLISELNPFNHYFPFNFILSYSFWWILSQLGWWSIIVSRKYHTVVWGNNLVFKVLHSSQFLTNSNVPFYIIVQIEF